MIKAFIVIITLLVISLTTIETKVEPPANIPIDENKKFIQRVFKDFTRH